MSTMFNHALIRSQLRSAWPFWYFCIGFAIAYGFAHFAPTPVAAVVYFGTALQFLGVCFVGWGLSKIREEYQLPTLRRSVVGWIKRWRLVFGGQTISEGIASASGSAALSGVAAITATGRLSGDISDRVLALEADLRALRTVGDERDRRVNERVDVLTKRMTDETSGLATAVREVDERVRNLAVGDFELEVVGLLWVGVGTVCAGVPEVVARLIWGSAITSP